MKQAPERALDRTNLRILEELTKNGRKSYSDIAETLNCSINTVRDRMFAMERRGVIRGYHARIDEAMLGRPLRCLVFLEAESGIQRPAELAKGLQLPGVLSAELTTGPYALIVEIAATDMAGLHDLIRTSIYPLGFRKAKVMQVGPPASALVATSHPVQAFDHGEKALVHVGDA
jgi:Lrp/AsnC family transcriptional regulator, leucine-responsive regulatory protein